MGIFDNIVSGMSNMVKTNYKNATGRNYDRDFQKFIDDYESSWNYSDSDHCDLERRWDELRDNNSIRYVAEKNAVRDLMKRFGLDIY